MSQVRIQKPRARRRAPEESGAVERQVDERIGLARRKRESSAEIYRWLGLPSWKSGS